MANPMRGDCFRKISTENKQDYLEDYLKMLSEGVQCRCNNYGSEFASLIEWMMQYEAQARPSPEEVFEKLTLMLKAFEEQ